MLVVFGVFVVVFAVVFVVVFVVVCSVCRSDGSILTGLPARVNPTSHDHAQSGGGSPLQEWHSQGWRSRRFGGGPPFDTFVGRRNQIIDFALGQV